MPMSTPFRVKGIDHIVIRANDVGVMVRFYSDVLGCVLERADPDIGLYQLRAGRSLIDLVDVEGELGRAGGGAPKPDARNMDHLCIGVDPFDEQTMRHHLSSYGVTPGDVVRRYGAEGRGPSMYIEDPEHNVVELKGPPD
jgi:catechol 2,3-dioxygenase-like lactoylglutathione lyase family enzyme